MFADQECVDQFVLEYSKDAKEAPGVSFLPNELLK